MTSRYQQQVKVFGSTGPSSPKSKFTTEQVYQIHQEHADGISAMRLAFKYEVNVTTIHRLLSGRTYSRQKNTPVSQAEV
jgi:Mor family transcriptional regulator